jgi:hypothetical protein
VGKAEEKAFFFGKEIIVLGSPYGKWKINVPLFRTCVATSEVLWK